MRPSLLPFTNCWWSAGDTTPSCVRSAATFHRPLAEHPHRRLAVVGDDGALVVGEQADQHRLAGAVGADDRRVLALADGQLQAVQHRPAALDDGGVAQREHGRVDHPPILAQSRRACPPLRPHSSLPVRPRPRDNPPRPHRAARLSNATLHADLDHHRRRRLHRQQLRPPRPRHDLGPARRLRQAHLCRAPREPRRRRRRRPGALRARRHRLARRRAPAVRRHGADGGGQLRRREPRRPLDRRPGRVRAHQHQRHVRAARGGAGAPARRR